MTGLHRISLLVFFLCIATVQASDYPGVSGLGTLFTSPMERQQLDAMRLRVLAGGTKDDAAAQAKTSKITVKGLVMRNGSKPVVWVNDSNTMKHNRLGNVLVRIDGIKQQSTKIPVKISQKNIRIKPGQQWDEGSNRVEDIYLTK
ncbi:MAG: hypothetical protein OEY43_05920 [Gammaproteobacteria bacterium]|nr:hypothetical protein [Gammaproteobacteria bacterium]